MRKYILISDKTAGFIALCYDPRGYMLEWRMCCWDIKEDGLRKLLEGINHFLHFSMLRDWVQENGHLKIIPADNDLSFDRFWEVYDNKRNRLEAEKLWNRLSPEERHWVFCNIEAYNRYIKRMSNDKYKQFKKYPDGYLNKLRKDDWDKVEKENEEYNK